MDLPFITHFLPVAILITLQSFIASRQTRNHKDSFDT